MTLEEQIWFGDPVKVAVELFHGSEDNRRLWGWYCKRMGRTLFRQALQQKASENRADGEPRSPPAAFQALLCSILPKQ